MRFHDRQTGLTLLELIVAITIMILLAGFITPLVKNALDDAKVARLVSLVQSLRKAAQKYYFDTGQLPIESSLGNQHHLFSGPAIPIANWKGPYIDRPLNANDNPWRTAIHLSNLCTGEPLFHNGYAIGGSSITSGAELALFGLNESIAEKIEIALESAGDVDALRGICEYGPNPAIPSSDPDAVDLYILLVPAQ